MSHPPANQQPVPATRWELEWARSFRSVEELIQEDFLRPAEIESYKKVMGRFRFVLPRYYAALIDKSDPQCPIRLQALPSLEELTPTAGFVADPLQDLKHQPFPRLTHRYRNRLLFHLTSNCSMFCRYCFRKTLLNELSDEFFGGQDEVLFDYLRAHPEVEEVIFSGGDPLMVTDRRLHSVLSQLESVVHIRRVRFHTRVPVTFPLRITQSLCEGLSGRRFPVILVTHFNHPRELTPQSLSALSLLKRNGIWLLNQSVLLQKINADAETLIKLSEGLFEQGVLPYYLHHPDRAEGTHHFDVPREQGLQIYDEVRSRLPGYLVPRYVVDVVGTPYKPAVSETI